MGGKGSKEKPQQAIKTVQPTEVITTDNKITLKQFNNFIKWITEIIETDTNTDPNYKTKKKYILDKLNELEDEDYSKIKKLIDADREFSIKLKQSLDGIVTLKDKTMKEGVNRNLQKIIDRVIPEPSKDIDRC